MCYRRTPFEREQTARARRSYTSTNSPKKSVTKWQAKDGENLFVQEAFHKAFIEVQEKGTEAAAATAVVVDVRSTSVEPPPPPPKVFEADHPFLFVIRDKKSNAILFIGRVNDPTQ